MKRAAKIILMIGGILEVLAIVSLLGCGVAAFVASANKDMIEEFVYAVARMIGEGGQIPQEFFDMGAWVLMGIGAGCVVVAIPSIVLVVLAFTSLKDENKKGKNIAGIILSILCCQIVTLAGFILNLIAGARAERKPIEEQPIEENK